MNELQIFNSDEFGEIRTVTIDNEPWFVGKDVALALGYKNTKDALAAHVENCDKIMGSQNATPSIKDSIGREQYPTWINESGLYALIFGSKLESAKRFKRWVTSEVLPAIRRTGTYGLPQTTDGKIALLAQGYTEMFQKVGEVSDRVDRIENDMPLYGCESDELSAHVKRKVVNLLGGKQSEAYRDRNLRSKLFRAVYTGISSEFGLLYESGRPKSYKNLKRKYLYDAHEYIDTFQVPIYLQEIIDQANSQMRMAV